MFSNNKHCSGYQAIDLSSDEDESNIINLKKTAKIKIEPIKIAYYLPNETYPYVTTSTILSLQQTNEDLTMNTNSKLTLCQIKTIIHKNSMLHNCKYLFLQYLTHEKFQLFTEIFDDNDHVPYYNENNNKIICFLVEKNI